MKIKTINELSEFDWVISVTSYLWTSTSQDISYSCTKTYYIHLDRQLILHWVPTRSHYGHIFLYISMTKLYDKISILIHQSDESRINSLAL